MPLYTLEANEALSILSKSVAISVMHSPMVEHFCGSALKRMGCKRIAAPVVPISRCLSAALVCRYSSNPADPHSDGRPRSVILRVGKATTCGKRRITARVERARHSFRYPTRMLRPTVPLP
jgi:hypothetical protein